jgi:hypothetical protein
MSALITEAHLQLTRAITGHSDSFQYYAQLIADSEAAAVQTAMIREYGNLCATNESLAKECDQLRADRDYNHECINRLASATGTFGEKSEKVVEVALSTIDQLRAERDWLKTWQDQAETNYVIGEPLAKKLRDTEAELAAAKLLLNEETDCAEAVEAAIVRQYARAERAEAELHALRLVCGTTDADKFTTWVDRANARAERAEAELAAENARLDWLESDAGMDFQWSTVRVITRAAIDAEMKEGAK